MAKELIYERIKRTLKEEIKSGLYPPGSLLPPEQELEKIFNASRSSIRKAVGLLQEEGLLDVKQGRGTMVQDARARQNFNRTTSVTETLRNNGYKVTTKSMYIDSIPANRELAKGLEIIEGDRVARVQRIQLADGIPICIMTNYIPYKMTPNFEQYMGKFVAFYQLIEQEYGIEIESTNDIIYAGGASFMDAELLDVPIGTPLLRIDRTCFSNNNPVCRDEVKILANYYALHVSTEGRQK